MRSLETICPLVVGSAEVGVTPGPSQWKFGLPVTPVGRVTEEVRVIVSPAMIGEEREEVREMVAGSEEVFRVCYYKHATYYDKVKLPRVKVSISVTVLGSVLEVATMVTK